MIRKIILGATLSLFTMGASAASLTLVNNESTPIQVNCNQITGLPIPAKQDGGKLSLPYFLIYVKFESKDLQCTFTDGAGATGTAHLIIGSNLRTAQIQSYNPQTGVTISPLSAVTTPASNITVTLDKL